jgi:hypothetical protein
MILQGDIKMTFSEGFLSFVRAEDSHTRFFETVSGEAFQSSFSSKGERPGRDKVEAPLDEAAEGERDYVRDRLRKELGREPSEEEVDEWLRHHTEGY